MNLEARVNARAFLGRDQWTKIAFRVHFRLDPVHRIFFLAKHSISLPHFQDESAHCLIRDGAAPSHCAEGAAANSDATLLKKALDPTKNTGGGFTYLSTSANLKKTRVRHGSL